MEASPENKKLGLAFANAVTVAVPCARPSSSTIARSGEHSVFDLFTRCFRRCTRDNSRSGLSSFEMNNELEKSGFTRVRVRKNNKNQDHDLFEGGTSMSSFRYSSRRWRDPDDVDDLAFLRSVWPDVNSQAKTSCSLAVVLECLREAVTSCGKLCGAKKSTGKPLLSLPQQTPTADFVSTARLASAASQATTPMAQTQSPSATLAKHPGGAHDVAPNSQKVIPPAPSDTAAQEAMPSALLELVVESLGAQPGGKDAECEWWEWADDSQGSAVQRLLLPASEPADPLPEQCVVTCSGQWPDFEV